MPQLDVAGVQVEFPFTPYDVQVQYMEKVVRALQQGCNALLESPTGTGKVRAASRGRHPRDLAAHPQRARA